MPREDMHDLLAFIAVAREGSFTRAAAQLGITQPTLSHQINGLEKRLGIRLLTRTTRSVSTTDVGQRLLHTVAPRLKEVEAAVAAAGDLREKPAGTIRITATDYSANTILWPKLAGVLHDYPDLKVEIATDYALADIVAQRFDIGVRWGDMVAQDMIAVRIAPDRRMVIVGSPWYFRQHPVPTTPQQLTGHSCINLRLPTSGGILAWELRKGRRELQVRVEGQLTFSSVFQTLDAALAGYGLTYVPEDMVEAHLASGRLQQVLNDWSPTFPGHHAYYASRRQSSRALTVVIEALRHRT
jgi:DNA-binding transcriptional LysR family regulator